MHINTNQIRNRSTIILTRQANARQRKSPFQFETNRDWYITRRGKVDRCVNDIHINYDNRQIINQSNNTERLYTQIRNEINDISQYKITQLKQQRDKIIKKTDNKLKEIAQLEDEYISDKLNENKDLLCSYHNIINQMNLLTKLYNYVQLKINAVRISNNALNKQVKDSEEENKGLIKNVFYYKSSIRQLLIEIKALQDKAQSIIDEKESSLINKKTNTDDSKGDKMIFNRLKHKQLKLTETKNQTLTDFDFGTTTTSFNNHNKSSNYVSHLYKTMNTFTYKKNNITKRRLNTQSKSNRICEIVSLIIEKNKEKYQSINEAALKLYNNPLIMSRMIEEKGYRHMFIDSIIKNAEIKQMMEGKLFPELTAFNRIIKSNYYSTSNNE